MNSNIKQRVKLAEKLILRMNPEPKRPFLVIFDRKPSPTKYFANGKEFTKTELDKYLEQFKDTEGMTIYTPLKEIHLTREPTV